MSCIWLVQEAVRGETRERLERACAENGNPVHRIPVVPFSTEMPAQMPNIGGDPFVFYGYTTLLLNAFHSSRWRRGVFVDPHVFRPSVYQEKWGAYRMLNSDARILTMRAFAEEDSPPSASWFVKPDDDLKRFTGSVMTYSEYREWYEGIRQLDGAGDIGPETKILVCAPKTVGYEWRFFFVGGRIAAKSCYTGGGRDRLPPPEMERFVQEAAADWSPAPALALDAALDSQGTPCLIEANCINGSGLYFAHTLSLVRALSSWQEITWPNE